ncbi:MAG TPA: DUF5666 domain-containing protein [Bryobacteraceae bacterium]|nr:DUF5666 domain-containing protein [Bryobacteraceae bacterium]
MKLIAITILATLGLLAPLGVQAHDASQHKGKATSGEIVSLGDDRFELKTATGTVPVTYTSKTKFEHGKEAVDKTHLQKGEKVSVIGTKLPNGDLVAKEIILGAAGTKNQTDSKMDHSKMGHEPKAEPAHKH